MHYLLDFFDRENGILNNPYDDYRDTLQVAFAILSGHDHSGSSAAFVANSLERYHKQRLSDHQKSTTTAFKTDVNFKDLFEQLDRWWDGTDPFGAPCFFTFLTVLTRVFRHDPISPLTGEDNEWVKVAPGLFQNKRLGSVFKNTTTGTTYWGEGTVLMDFYSDYSGVGTYHSNATPTYTIEFPFDIRDHPIQYYLRKPGTKDEFLIHGPYEEIKDQVETYRRHYCRNWMLGLDPSGTYYRKEALERIDYRELCAALIHFDNLIKPMVDSEGFDLYRLTPEQRSLFEGSKLMVVSAKTQALLYHAALRYSELDPVERQKIFKVSTRVQVFHKPEPHFQSYQPIAFPDNPAGTARMGAELGVLYLDQDNQPLSPEQARKYLFEQCKQHDLAFKPGKTGPITQPQRLGDQRYVSAWVTPYIEDESDTDSALRSTIHTFMHEYVDNKLNA